MLTIRDHDVEDYVALRDMDATDVGTLSEDDRACLDELGDYLVSTDAFQRFAIWLLHKHFEPDCRRGLCGKRHHRAARNQNHTGKAVLRAGFERDLDAF